MGAVAGSEVVASAICTGASWVPGSSSWGVLLLHGRRRAGAGKRRGRRLCDMQSRAAREKQQSGATDAEQRDAGALLHPGTSCQADTGTVQLQLEADFPKEPPVAPT